MVSSDRFDANNRFDANDRFDAILWITPPTKPLGSPSIGLTMLTQLM